MAFRELSESEWLLPRYKYCTLNYDLYDSNHIHSLENLENSIIFFQSPAKFNDPFDSKYCIIPCSVEDYEKSVRKAIFETTPNLPVEEIEKKTLELCARRKQDDVLTGYKRLKDDHFRRLGIFCLAPNNTEILMWSHYADSHSGICLEIDLVKCWQYLAAENPLILFGAVGYSDDFPREGLMSSYLSNNNNDALNEVQEVLFTKSTHWLYEAEVRIVAVNFAGKAVNFGKSIYKSVTVGTNTSPENISKVKTILRNRGDNLPLYRAVPKQDKYELEIHRLDY
jgi:Protein of unknown function (DUF2971)